MPTFELRVRMPHGGEQKIIVHSTNRRNAEAMAEAQTGGKVLGGRQLPSWARVDSDTTLFVESLNGIANCARSLVRLCVADPVRFHRHMAHELCLTLFEPVPGWPGQVINTLFRSTGEFDLHVELSVSVEGPEQITVYFDASKLAWCNSRVVSTASTVSVDDGRVGMTEVPAWIVDQDEAANWASGAGVAPGDSAGAVRETEAAALDAWEHLAQLVRYASATEQLSDEGEGCHNAVHWPGTNHPDAQRFAASLNPDGEGTTRFARALVDSADSAQSAWGQPGTPEGAGFVWTETEQLSVSCGRDSFNVNALAVQATGYMSRLMLTIPFRVQKIRQAFAAGMPAGELSLRARRLGQGQGGQERLRVSP